MVAKETITVRGEFGEQVDLKAGQTFIHAQRHFLVTEYPDLWEPGDWRPYRQRGGARSHRPRAWRL